MTIVTSLAALPKRIGARRDYTRLTGWLNDTLEALRVEVVPSQRAALMREACGLLEDLAARHTEAWGRDCDAEGRPAAVSIGTAAQLLGVVAETELTAAEDVRWAVRGLNGPVDSVGVVGADELVDADASAAEVAANWALMAERRLWAELGHCRDRAARARLLEQLHQQVRIHVGERAAGVLATVAATDWHLAGRHERCCPPEAPTVTRPLVAAVFFVIGVVLPVPLLPMTGPEQVLVAAGAVTGTAGALGARLWWIGRIGRSARRGGGER
ncbi:hypothetical protein GCM10009678_86380 [Actinomadura kijaniata]|uniref:Uncharacterized protein n=1 Tax=Actinomadura namibiensis TaxID=182080 RepID=A0A7W3M0F8_ACTNM|nr:hypothetical protein [Actinomadura namibiensis]MBA8957708.1 hypothetical protein [Actinomadura namibiensis]